jgi:hypothetical protein
MNGCGIRAFVLTGNCFCSVGFVPGGCVFLPCCVWCVARSLFLRVGGLAGGGFRAFVKCGGCSFVLLYFMYLFLLFLLPFVWLSFSLAVASLYLPLIPHLVCLMPWLVVFNKCLLLKKKNITK